MSQSHQDETQPTTEVDSQGPQAPGTDIHAEPGTAESDAPTIGTGTSLALGCIAGTVLLIAIGLLYILILTIF